MKLHSTIPVIILLLVIVTSCRDIAHAEKDYISPEREFFSNKGFKLDSVGYREAGQIYFPFLFSSKPFQCDSCDLEIYSSYIKSTGKNAVERFELYKIITRDKDRVLRMTHSIEYEINISQVERVISNRNLNEATAFYLDTGITRWQMKENKRILDSLSRNTPKGHYLCGTAIGEIIRLGEGDSKKLTVSQARKKIQELLTR